MNQEIQGDNQLPLLPNFDMDWSLPLEGDNQLPLLPTDFNFDMDWSLPLEGDSGGGKAKYPSMHIEESFESQSTLATSASSFIYPIFEVGFINSPNLNPNDIGKWIPSPNQEFLKSSALSSAFLQGNIGEPTCQVSSSMNQVTPLGRDRYNAGWDPYRQNTYAGLDNTPISDSIAIFPSNDHIHLGSTLPIFIGGGFLDHGDPARGKEGIVLNAGDSCENNASIRSNSREIVPLRPLESTPTRTKRVKAAKPRLQCQQTGCKSTFLRRYELNRHEDSVHNRNTALLCPVYGCNRAQKSFPRPDKFHEHFRKHGNPDRFLCIIEECRHGPFTKAEVESHLRGYHNMERCRQPYLDVILKVLNLRGTPLGDGEFRMDYIDSCPLAFLGCTYRVSGVSLEDHVEQHELAERSKGYTAIVATLGHWAWMGKAICPICQGQMSSSFTNVWDLLQHVGTHSRQGRVEHAVELSEQISPFLNGKENVIFWKRDLFDMIRGDLQEAGAISPAARVRYACTKHTLAHQCQS